MTTVEYHLNPKGAVLDAYFRDRSRCSFIMGSLGSGKTTTTAQKLLKLMCEQEPNALGVRPTRWYAVRNTYGDLMSTTVKDWLEIAGHLGHFTKGGLEPPTHRLKFRLEDGTTVDSEVVFLALDREDAIKKLRGSQVTGFWLNEAKELLKAILDMADLRHGRYPSDVSGGVRPTWHGILGDTNAPEQGSWYYNLAEELKPLGWTFFRQPGAVINLGDEESPQWVINPEAENVENLPGGADYYLKGLLGKEYDWINVNLANNYGYVKSGRLVYPDYKDSVHCKEADYIPALPIHRGWDFGLTPACIFAQLHTNGRFVILDEMTTSGMGITRFSEDVLLHSGRQYPNAKFIDVGDPAGNQRAQTDERTCFQILIGKGIQITGGDQDPNIRLESVRYALNNMRDGKPILQLHPRCTELRKGFMGGYHYRKLQTAEERYSSEPEKNASSHPHDALQYICTTLFAGMVRSENIITINHHYEPTRMMF